MAGGVGSRFWPYSRERYPKQFLDILGTGKSLIRQTFERFLPITDVDRIFVVTNAEYGDLVIEHLPELEDDQILREPMRKNTAPCIAYAAFKIASKDPDSVMIVTPADHVILKEETFHSKALTACEAAWSSDKLVTIGITPNRPETGYGYIQFLADEAGEKDVVKVKTFTEKPDLQMAQTFLDSGEFLWNAGIFIWKTQVIIEALHSNLPEIAEAFEDLNDKYYTPQEEEELSSTYQQCKNISIDYGIMESAGNVYVVPADLGWSDLGNWDSIHDLSDKDGNGNVVDGNALLYNSKNCLIKTPDDKLVVLDGLEGFLVTEHEGVLLICRKDNEKQIREYVKAAREKGSRYL
jgi:mannose-1-phosphate guanylyltransferase